VYKQKKNSRVWDKKIGNHVKDMTWRTAVAAWWDLDKHSEYGRMVGYRIENVYAQDP